MLAFGKNAFMVVDIVLPAVLSPADFMSAAGDLRRPTEYLLVLVWESGIEA